jgi:GNAT superfamily N-acetyltransferase
MMTGVQNTLDLKTILIRPLDNELSVRGFDCGDADLNQWINKKAFSHHTENRVKVFCAYSGGAATALGYYTLAMKYESVSKLLQEERGHYTNDKHFPAIYIGSLAVRTHYQGQKLGTLLLMNALKRAHNVAKNVALFGVALHSLNDRTTEMYKRYGFGLREDCHLPLMVLPIWSLNDLIEPK